MGETFLPAGLASNRPVRFWGIVRQCFYVSTVPLVETTVLLEFASFSSRVNTPARQ